jgi:N-acyl-D-aspartate/D-glutamate deacylase/CubicO group peptidase (beta-lactamase class C family)
MFSDSAMQTTHHFMKSIRHVCFFVVLFWVAQPALSAQVTPDQLRKLDTVLSVLHGQASFNGTVLVAEQGKVVYAKALGIAHPDTRKIRTTAASFNLGSLSEQFMAAMVVVLQESGKLQFDDAVRQYFPDFPYEGVTLRHLLTHTSGLPDYTDLAIRYHNTLDTLTNEKVLELLKSYKPPAAYAPGTHWGYCNTNYVLLASIMEQVSAQPIETFFQQQVTGPLGMTNTYIYSLRVKDTPTNRVFGFKRQDGVDVLHDLTRLDGVIGDGNVYASAEDLLKWDQALYTEKLFRLKTWKAVVAPEKRADGATDNNGFGWMMGKDSVRDNPVGFRAGGCHAFIRNIEKKQTIIILTSGSDDTARKIALEVLDGKTVKLPKFQLITHISLLDGTGTPAKTASVRLKNDKIWEVGDLMPFEGETVTDGQGLTLAPGFIDSHSHHFGGLGSAPEALPTINQGITTIVIGQDGVSVPIDTIQHFFQTTPVSINVATYTGQSTLREDVMGAKNLFRIATLAEVATMKAALQAEMAKGSLGLSTGLEYEEAFYSNRDEVLELAKIAAAAGGRYISHIRSEDINLDEAVDEIIEIGKEAHIPVQISHIKIAKRDQWGTSSDLLERLQAARNAGIDITADCYPYDFWNSTLRVLFPNRDYTNPASAAFAVTQLCDPEKSIVVRFAPNKQYAGKTLAAIAALRHENAAETLMKLIAMAAAFDEQNPDFDGGIEAIMGKSMDEPDVENFLVWPQTNICSDGSGHGHPRGYGAFTRILGRYVREKKIMPLETAVYKMTALSAEHLGLSDRGIIQAGNYADLVLFNPETVKDNADITNPKALSTGIEKVWVNGQLVYQAGQSTGKYPGMFIKR